MNFSLQDKPCSNQIADSWFPTAVISHFYSAVYIPKPILAKLGNPSGLRFIIRGEDIVVCRPNE